MLSATTQPNNNVLKAYCKQLRSDSININRSLSKRKKTHSTGWKSLSTTFSTTHKNQHKNHSMVETNPSIKFSHSKMQFYKKNLLQPYSKTTAIQKRRSSSNFSSIGSKEHYYHNREEAVKHHNLLKSTSVSSMKNIQNEFTSASSEKNWRFALRNQETDDVLQRYMKFGPVLSTDSQRKHFRKKKIKTLSDHENKLYNYKLQRWCSTRGYQQQAHNPVTAEQYHLYYEAFKSIAKKSGDGKHDQIKTMDIYHIAKELGITTSLKEIEKVANIIDSDGSQMITFEEMVHTLKELSDNDKQPYIGGQMTFDLLLLHYSRQKTMNTVMDMVRNEQKYNAHASDLYFRHRRNFKAETRRANLCHHCLQTFKYDRELEDHILTVHEYNGNYFTCYQCGEKWIPISKQSQHIAQHRTSVESKAGYRCSHCQQVFRSGETLAHHISQNHTPLELDIFRCSKCDQSFSSKKQLEFHDNELHTIKKPRRSRKVTQVSSLSQDINDEFEEMTPAEFRQMQSDFFSSPKRNGLSNRVNHLRTIQILRNNFDDNERKVDVLKPLFDKKDELLKQQQNNRKTIDVLGFLNSSNNNKRYV